MESVKDTIGGNGMVVTRVTTSNIGSDHNSTNTNAANHRGDFVFVCCAVCVCECVSGSCVFLTDIVFPLIFQVHAFDSTFTWRLRGGVTFYTIGNYCVAQFRIHYKQKQPERPSSS